MKRPLRPAIAAIVLTLAGLSTWWLIASRDASDAIEVTGTVEATEADLGFQLPGLLERINAREGDLVAPGAELAVLESSELKAQREVALAQIEAARALLAEYVAGSRAEEIARARALLSVAVERRDAARRDVERLRSLAEQQLVSRQSFDHQETELGVAEGEAASATEELRLLQSGTRKERIAAQRAALSEAMATLQRIDARLAQSTIRAPFAGTVTVRHREPGEAVNSGSPVITVQNLDDRWVRAYVPGDEVGRLTHGQCALIASDGFAERRYTGVISYIASVAEFTPRNVQSSKDRVRLVYEVRVRITGDKSVDLKPGLPGDVTFAGTVARGAETACATPSAPALTVTGD